jgi:hypothetical protein
MEVRQVRIRRDPNCVVCGDQPTITELIDYDEFCGTAPVHIDLPEAEQQAKESANAATIA